MDWTKTAMPTRLLTVLALAALAACSGSGRDAAEAPPPKAAAAEPAALTVNGEPVPQRLLDALASMRGLDLNNPQQRERAVKQLGDFVLVDQMARKEGYADDPSFASMVELGRLQAVSSATMRHLQTAQPIDDAAIRAEYDRQMAKGAGKVYDFSQLVYADEAAARKGLAAIGAKPFDASLDSYRKDARSARNYTQVRAAQLAPALASALESLKPGETAKAPVQLPQGWAVLHLAAAGEATAPAFEQVKENLRRVLARRAVDARMAELRQNATIVPAEPAAPAAAPAAGQ